MAVSLDSFLLKGLYLIFPEKERDTEIFLKNYVFSENNAQNPAYFRFKNAENHSFSGMILEYAPIVFRGQVTAKSNFIAIKIPVLVKNYRHSRKDVDFTSFYRFFLETFVINGQKVPIFEGFVN